METSSTGKSEKSKSYFFIAGQIIIDGKIPIVVIPKVEKPSSTVSVDTNMKRSTSEDSNSEESIVESTSSLKLHSRIPATKIIQKGRRHDFNQNERKAIVEYIIRNNAYTQVGGVSLWKTMSQEFPCHTWHSLKNHFVKKIKPFLSTYKLSPEIIDKFRQGQSGNQECVKPRQTAHLPVVFGTRRQDGPSTSNFTTTRKNLSPENPRSADSNDANLKVLSLCDTSPRKSSLNIKYCELSESEDLNEESSDEEVQSYQKNTVTRQSPRNVSSKAQYAESSETEDPNEESSDEEVQSYQKNTVTRQSPRNVSSKAQYAESSETEDPNEESSDEEVQSYQKNTVTSQSPRKVSSKAQCLESSETEDPNEESSDEEVQSYQKNTVTSQSPRKVSSKAQCLESSETEDPNEESSDEKVQSCQKNTVTSQSPRKVSSKEKYSESSETENDVGNTGKTMCLNLRKKRIISRKINDTLHHAVLSDSGEASDSHDYGETAKKSGSGLRMLKGQEAGRKCSNILDDSSSGSGIMDITCFSLNKSAQSSGVDSQVNSTNQELISINVSKKHKSDKRPAHYSESEDQSGSNKRQKICSITHTNTKQSLESNLERDKQDEFSVMLDDRNSKSASVESIFGSDDETTSSKSSNFSKITVLYEKPGCSSDRLQEEKQRSNSKENQKTPEIATDNKNSSESENWSDDGLCWRGSIVKKMSKKEDGKSGTDCTTLETVKRHNSVSLSVSASKDSLKKTLKRQRNTGNSKSNELSKRYMVKVRNASVQSVYTQPPSTLVDACVQTDPVRIVPLGKTLSIGEKTLRLSTVQSTQKKTIVVTHQLSKTNNTSSDISKVEVLPAPCMRKSLCTENASTSTIERETSLTVQRQSPLKQISPVSPLKRRMSSLTFLRMSPRKKRGAQLTQSRLNRSGLSPTKRGA